MMSARTREHLAFGVTMAAGALLGVGAVVIWWVV